MSDFRKPRPDYPIYPSTGYYRKRAEVFKRPKGRKGKKPKGQKLVPRGQAQLAIPSQAQDFFIIKAQDEARKARELAIAEAKAIEEDRKEKKENAKKELELRQAELFLSAAGQLATQNYREQKRADAQQEREQLRLESDRREERLLEDRRQLSEQFERLYESQERRAGEAQQQLRIESDRRERRLLEDRRKVESQFERLYESQERRQGENLAIFRDAFKAITDRRPVDFRDIREQEQTDLKLSPEDRRDRRSRSPSRESAVSAGFESLATAPRARQRTPSPERERQVKQVKQQFQPKPEPEPQTEEGAVNVPIETIEQTTRKGRDVKKPVRFEEGATTPELAAGGAIVGQTPQSVRGGSGSKETKRRGKDAGKESTPVIGGSKERLEALSLTEKTPSQVKKEVEGVKFSPATTGGLTESQVSRDLEELAKRVKGD